MSKGSEFERQFCDRLSEWWTGEKGRRVFWRSSNSGGMATARNKKGKKTKQHCGDVCAIDPVGFPLTDLITIELKRGYSRHTIADLLDKPKNTAKQLYEKWIEQAERAAEGAGTPHWMLVVKRDHRKPLIFLTQHLMHRLSGIFRSDQSHLNMYLPSMEGGISGESLESFLSLVTPTKFLQAMGEENAS